MGANLLAIVANRQRAIEGMVRSPFTTHAR
jgi:hypothetical protein